MIGYRDLLAKLFQQFGIRSVRDMSRTVSRLAAEREAGTCHLIAAHLPLRFSSLFGAVSIQESVRGFDIVGFLDDHTIAVLLRDTDAKNVDHITERLRSTARFSSTDVGECESCDESDKELHDHSRDMQEATSLA